MGFQTCAHKSAVVFGARLSLGCESPLEGTDAHVPELCARCMHSMYPAETSRSLGLMAGTWRGRHASLQQPGQATCTPFTLTQSLSYGCRMQWPARCMSCLESQTTQAAGYPHPPHLGDSHPPHLKLVVGCSGQQVAICRQRARAHIAPMAAQLQALQAGVASRCTALTEATFHL
eukprot:1154420-Pelagomonas_calceolata.AAC.2